MVVHTLVWIRKVSDLIHGKYLFCFCNTINLLGDTAMLDLEMQSCSCYTPINHLNEMQVLLFCEIRYYSHFLSIHSSIFKTQSGKIYSSRIVTLHLKMATLLIFAGRWTEKGHHFAYVSMSIIKQFNAITFQKFALCGCNGKSIFSGFILTLKLGQKQHII